MKDSERPYQQYICRACGLIYDEAEGDPDSGLAPGTRFEDIPDDWECPLCGVTKTDFELFEKRAAAAASAAGLQTTGIVVVGAGLAGWGVVEAIREHDAGVAITLICACTGDRYHKPELSVALSRGLTAKKLVRESARVAAQRLGVHLINNTFVTGLSPDAKQLRTTHGTLQYTDLVLAQGARPALPENLSEERCWRINNLHCWSALAQRLQERPQKIAIVGAGMVGCELAEDLAKAGHAVSLINRDAYPLANLLPEKAGRRLLDSLTLQNINHYASARVSELSDLPSGKRLIRFSGGRSHVFDHVIAATGLRTDDRLARQAGLAFEGGIVVDPQTLRSSCENIYALGDCISLGGQPCRFIEPIARQARVIAQGILNLPAERYLHQPPVVRLKTRALPLVLHGLPLPGQPWQTLVDTPNELIMEQHSEAGVIAQLRLQGSKQSQAA